MDVYDKKQRFQKLYSAYIDEIYRYVFLRTGLQKATAEDITQEVFMDVFKGLDRFIGLCSERTWIYKITKNKVSDYYRTYYKRIMESEGITDELINKAADPDQDIGRYIEDKYNSQFIMECLGCLPEHYKITLLLKYIDGKSVREIAVIADKSEKAIESILQRAKTAFIRQYQKTQGGRNQS